MISTDQHSLQFDNVISALQRDSKHTGTNEAIRAYFVPESSEGIPYMQTIPTFAQKARLNQQFQIPQLENFNTDLMLLWTPGSQGTSINTFLFSTTAGRWAHYKYFDPSTSVANPMLYQQTVTTGAALRLCGATSSLNSTFIGGVSTAVTVSSVPGILDTLTPSQLEQFIRVQDSRAAISTILEGTVALMPLPGTFDLVNRFESLDIPGLGNVNGTTMMTRSEQSIVFNAGQDQQYFNTSPGVCFSLNDADSADVLNQFVDRLGVYEVSGSLVLDNTVVQSNGTIVFGCAYIDSNGDYQDTISFNLPESNLINPGNYSLQNFCFRFQAFNIVHSFALTYPQGVTVASGFVKLCQLSGGSTTLSTPSVIIIVAAPSPDIQYSLTGVYNYACVPGPSSVNLVHAVPSNPSTNDDLIVLQRLLCEMQSTLGLDSVFTTRQFEKFYKVVPALMQRQVTHGYLKTSWKEKGRRLGQITDKALNIASNIPGARKYTMPFQAASKALGTGFGYLGSNVGYMAHTPEPTPQNVGSAHWNPTLGFTPSMLNKIGKRTRRSVRRFVRAILRSEGVLDRMAVAFITNYLMARPGEAPLKCVEIIRDFINNPVLPTGTQDDNLSAASRLLQSGDIESNPGPTDLQWIKVQAEKFMKERNLPAKDLPGLLLASNLIVAEGIHLTGFTSTGGAPLFLNADGAKGLPFFEGPTYSVRFQGFSLSTKDAIDLIARKSPIVEGVAYDEPCTHIQLPGYYAGGLQFAHRLAQALVEEVHTGVVQCKQRFMSYLDRPVTLHEALLHRRFCSNSPGHKSDYPVSEVPERRQGVQQKVFIPIVLRRLRDVKILDQVVNTYIEIMSRGLTTSMKIALQWALKYPADGCTQMHDFLMQYQPAAQLACEQTPVVPDSGDDPVDIKDSCADKDKEKSQASQVDNDNVTSLTVCVDVPIKHSHVTPCPTVEAPLQVSTSQIWSPDDDGHAEVPKCTGMDSVMASTPIVPFSPYEGGPSQPPDSITLPKDSISDWFLEEPTTNTPMPLFVHDLDLKPCQEVISDSTVVEPASPLLSGSPLLRPRPAGEAVVINPQPYGETKTPQGTGLQSVVDSVTLDFDLPPAQAKAAEMLADLIENDPQYLDFIQYLRVPPTVPERITFNSDTDNSHREDTPVDDMSLIFGKVSQKTPPIIGQTVKPAMRVFKRTFKADCSRAVGRMATFLSQKRTQLLTDSFDEEDDKSAGAEDQFGSDFQAEEADYGEELQEVDEDEEYEAQVQTKPQMAREKSYAAEDSIFAPVKTKAFALPLRINRLKARPTFSTLSEGSQFELGKYTYTSRYCPAVSEDLKDGWPIHVVVTPNMDSSGPSKGAGVPIDEWTYQGVKLRIEGVTYDSRDGERSHRGFIEGLLHYWFMVKGSKPASMNTIVYNPKNPTARQTGTSYQASVYAAVMGLRKDAMYTGGITFDSANPLASRRIDTDIIQAKTQVAINSEKTLIVFAQNASQLCNTLNAGHWMTGPVELTCMVCPQGLEAMGPFRETFSPALTDTVREQQEKAQSRIEVPSFPPVSWSQKIIEYMLSAKNPDGQWAGAVQNALQNADDNYYYSKEILAGKYYLGDEDARLTFGTIDSMKASVFNNLKANLRMLLKTFTYLTVPPGNDRDPTPAVAAWSKANPHAGQAQKSKQGVKYYVGGVIEYLVSESKYNTLTKIKPPKTIPEGYGQVTQETQVQVSDVLSKLPAGMKARVLELYNKKHPEKPVTLANLKKVINFLGLQDVAGTAKPAKEAVIINPQPYGETKTPRKRAGLLGRF